MSPYIHMPTLKNPPLHSSTIWKYKKTNQSKQKQKQILTGYGKVAEVFFIPKKKIRENATANLNFGAKIQNHQMMTTHKTLISNFCVNLFFLFSILICRQNSLLSSSKKQEENLMMYNIVIANYHLLIITLLLSPYYNY